jgi:predicted phage terminase large subunit-like protein
MTQQVGDLGRVGALIERGLIGLRLNTTTRADDPRWATPGTLAKALRPNTIQTPALDRIDAALCGLRNRPDGRLIVTMAPQEGKSVRVAHDFVVWWLKDAPETRVVGASYGQRLATRNGRTVRRTISGHPELGIRIADDHGAAHEWSLVDISTGKPTGGGLFSVGIGGGVTGQPADLMVIDDPIKSRKEADSEVYRDAVWDWWTDEASARLAPGAPVVLILTRWHEDDLAGRLLADDPAWQLLNIPAQADHNPEKGETDILGREPGEFMVSARGRTHEQWELRKRAAGSRTWQALYQGHPSAPAGTIFKRDWWQRYDTPQWFERDDGTRIVSGFDDLIISWDMTFKKTEGTDYVSGQVWARRGADAYLLDRVNRRMDFVDTLAAFRALAAKWPQATLKLVEDKANGPAVISMLGRKVPGIVPVEPDGGKEARAAAVAPLVEAGNVWLPASELAPWADDVIEQTAGFPTAQHDDDVDALSQALNRLILQPLLVSTQQFDAEELDEDLGEELAYFRTAL